MPDLKGIISSGIVVSLSLWYQLEAKVSLPLEETTTFKTHCDPMNN
jgi:hypothetical protein